ncbi:MAG: CopG family antitoxin [Bacteriovoracaceae bacterium]
MKSKALQKFSDEYLKNARTLSPEQVLSFLEDFRLLHGHSDEIKKSKLISMKVPQNLLNAFKNKAQLENIPYQTLIKKLMTDYLKHS